MNRVLRELKINDLPMIREWRNNSEINKYMFSQYIIKEKEHIEWFEENQKNSLKFLNVYEENEIIKGFLQIQKKSFESAVYEWGFYISPEATRGTGTKMAKLALDKIFIEFQGNKVLGEVFSFNLPSLNLHKKLGFYQEGLLRQQHFLNGDYYDIYCFGLLKSEWLEMLKNKDLL